MAGTYPNIPGHRFNMAQDGTRLYQLSQDQLISTNVDAQLPVISDTDDDYWEALSIGGYTNNGRWGTMVVVFPELRDIDGYFITMSGAGAQGYELQTSEDTTNGVDGTWVTRTNNWAWSGTTSPYYRTSINAFDWSNVRGLRFNYGKNNSYYDATQVRFHVVHIYGSIVAGQNPNRLRFWDPNSDIEAAPYHFDFGDIPQGGSSTKIFRVKNNSSTLTANDIIVSRYVPSFAEMTAGLQLSVDGTTWFDSIDIGDLGPGAVSPQLRVRRAAATGEASKPRNGFLKAEATTWV